MTGSGPWTTDDATRIPRIRPRPRHAVEVWLLHPGPDADYYETIFDFAAFVEATRDGVPRLRVWTGREDLDLAGLRATLRRIVAAEIDAARAQLAGRTAEAEDRRAMGFVLTLAAQGTLLAMRATPAGLAISALIGAAGLALGRAGAAGPEAAARLEAEIARVRAAADAAFAGLELRLHRDLSGGRGDPEAWPIPAAVRALMERGAPCR